MKSIYSKFVFATIAIIITSTLLGFFISNTYYHQHVKPLNDEKNVSVAMNIAGYIDEQENLDLDPYLKSAASMGYQIYVVNGSGYEQYFGANYKKENLKQAAVDSVLKGEIYHGML